MFKTLLAFIFVTLSIGANAASIYNHNGVDYEISTIVTSWAEDEALLTSQFWWGDENLTESVALASGPDLTAAESEVTYLFDYKYDSSISWYGPVVRYHAEASLDNCCFDDLHLQGGALGFETQAQRESEYVFAIASVSNVPLPAAAWLFGSALMGLGLIKRKKA